jgi:hypothetical protein
MFTFPLENWVGGIFYEHSHRLIASTGRLPDPRARLLALAGGAARWVRRLGSSRSARRSRRACSAASRCCGTCRTRSRSRTPAWREIVFCLTTTIALVTSPGGGAATRGAAGRADDRSLQRVARARSASSTCRSSSARRCGTPTPGWRFPTSRGCSGTSCRTTGIPKIAIHFAHRVGALCVTSMLLATTGHVFAHHRAGRAAAAVDPAARLVTLQVTLGALTVLSRKEYVINSLHVVTGACVLVTTLILTLRAHRARFGDAAGRRPRRAG